MKYTMHKLIKISSLLCLSLLLSANSFAKEQESPKLQVCAVTQLYESLEQIKKHSTIPFEAFYGTANEIYAKIANNEKVCDVVLSSDERLPLTLVRSDKADAVTMEPFTRAPLILWSQDPLYFKDGIKVITKQKIKSLALADPRLTPVGYATHLIVSNKAFKTSYLKDHIYRASHEYQILGMLSAGYVECGFITKPLISSKTKIANGSYWEVPRAYHPDLLYYSIILKNTSQKEMAQNFTLQLAHNENWQDILNAFGFASLKIDNEPYRMLLPGFKISY